MPAFKNDAPLYIVEHSYSDESDGLPKNSKEKSEREDGQNIN